MKIGDFDVEITSGRISGGWQAVGILPNGKKLQSAPCSSREDAEHDVKQQAEANLYPQRRYDVNRPFESMKLGENKFLKGAINPEHKGYCTPMSKSTCTPRRKALARRFKKGGDLHNESLSDADMAIVMHQADQLLEDARDYLELSLDGNQIERPECPYCGGEQSEPVGEGRHKCPNCNGVFAANVNQYPAGPLPPKKASFYPGGGGGAGVGGVSSV